MELIQEVMAYTPYNEQEDADRKTILCYLNKIPELYDRNCISHITCSPWIINQDNTKVLMVYHNIYDSWGWCGGHSDGEHNLLKVAIKEGKEETGLHHLEAVSDELFSLEVLPVYAHYKHGEFVSSHIHLNFTFLCRANDEDDTHYKVDENKEVRWIALKDIDSYVSEVTMLPIYHKLIGKTQKLIFKQTKK